MRNAAYQPKQIENQDLSLIKQPSGCSRGNFSMIFPPPNVTGNIHIGHALTATIQDVLARWKRSQGHDVKWIFGTDHAGIATQVVVEKILYKKYNKTRHELGREVFLEEVWKWKAEKGNEISKDLQKLAASFNWDEEYFTMDPAHTNAVNEAFIRLFEKGLIYRDVSLINFSCALESAISDVEVENLEINGRTQLTVPNYAKPVTVGLLYEVAYKIVNSNEEIVVATTRPETILGDTAVAVHPDDVRYSHLKDVKLWHPFRNEEIPLIFDESVKSDFGTGAVKITPAHDKNDFEVGKRHNLKNIQVITESGLIRDEFNQFARLPRFIARDHILKSLAEKVLLRGSKDHSMILPICSRSKDVIEFMLKPQWFVNCKEMSSRAVVAVENKTVKIIPDTFEREWFRWLRNCRDWCVSRQLWWGHQIPAYKIKEGEKEFWIAAKSEAEAKDKVQIQHPGLSNYTIERDPDVLDTWFSSALLPFSTFGWPNEINSDKFPLKLMETGHDILFFWVARMMMLSMELTGKIPFDEILLHGIVCDAFGRKMSKSLGNVLLPDQIINGATLSSLQKDTEASVAKGIISKFELEKSLKGQRKMFPNGIQECGVDALRFTLCSQNIKQHFINFDVNECFTNKLFFNKIWQATKYAINFAEKKNSIVSDMEKIGEDLTDMDLWILSRLGNTVRIVEQSLDAYNFYLATAALKTFFYNNFCDVYLETTKQFLVNEDEGKETAKVLNLSLAIALKHMENFTPYLANELQQFLPQKSSLNVVNFINESLESQVNDMLDVCASIREVKSQLKLTKKTKADIKVLIKSKDFESFLQKHINHVRHLTFSDSITLMSNAEEFDNEKFNASSTANHLCSFGIKFESSTIKPDVEINRKKLVKIQKDLDNVLKIVSNEGYKEKANEKVKKKHFERVIY